MSQTVLIFQEEAVLAADGRAGKSPQIQGVRREALKGYGDPFGRWRDALSRLQEQEPFGEVQLVLPASMCATRAIRLPYAKGKMLAEMADREIRDVLKSEIMDYAVIQADKAEGVILCGAGVEEKVLEQFLDLCEEFEMDVKGITVPMEGYLRVLTQMGEYKNHTAVFLFFEEGIVTSVLLQEEIIAIPAEAVCSVSPELWTSERRSCGIFPVFCSSMRPARVNLRSRTSITQAVRQRILRSARLASGT